MGLQESGVIQVSQTGANPLVQLVLLWGLNGRIGRERILITANQARKRASEKAWHKRGTGRVAQSALLVYNSHTNAR